MPEQPLAQVAGVIEFDFIEMHKVAETVYKLRGRAAEDWVAKQFECVTAFLHNVRPDDWVIAPVGSVDYVEIEGYKYVKKNITLLGVACPVRPGELCTMDAQCNTCVHNLLAKAEKDGRDATTDS